MRVCVRVSACVPALYLSNNGINLLVFECFDSCMKFTLLSERQDRYIRQLMIKLYLNFVVH